MEAPAPIPLLVRRAAQALRQDWRALAREARQEFLEKLSLPLHPALVEAIAEIFPGAGAEAQETLGAFLAENAPGRVFQDSAKGVVALARALGVAENQPKAYEQAIRAWSHASSDDALRTSGRAEAAAAFFGFFQASFERETQRDPVAAAERFFQERYRLEEWARAWPEANLSILFLPWLAHARQESRARLLRELPALTPAHLARCAWQHFAGIDPEAAVAAIREAGVLGDGAFFREVVEPSSAKAAPESFAFWLALSATNEPLRDVVVERLSSQPPDRPVEAFDWLCKHKADRPEVVLMPLTREAKLAFLREWRDGALARPAPAAADLRGLGRLLGRLPALLGSGGAWAGPAQELDGVWALWQPAWARSVPPGEEAELAPEARRIAENLAEAKGIRDRLAQEEARSLADAERAEQRRRETETRQAEAAARDARRAANQKKREALIAEYQTKIQERSFACQEAIVGVMKIDMDPVARSARMMELQLQMQKELAHLQRELDERLNAECSD